MQGLEIFKFMAPINQLNFKQLTLKTVTLVAITSSDRAQTRDSIDIEFSEITMKKYIFLFFIKDVQEKPTYKSGSVCSF